MTQAFQRADGRWVPGSRFADPWYSKTTWYPTGYCIGSFDEKYPEDPKDGTRAELWKQLRDSLLPRAEKYHSCGHATAEEALACQRDYDLDLLVRLDCEDELRRCVVCEGWTHRRIAAGNLGYTALCPTHDTREIADRILKDGEASVALCSEQVGA